MSAKILKIDMGKYIYVGCIPVYAHPERPTDQSYCIQRECPNCHGSMWVSEKKRALEAAEPKKVKIYCLECLVKGAINQGLDPEFLDIGKFR